MSDLILFPLIFSESRVEFIDTFTNISISGNIVGELKTSNLDGTKSLKLTEFVSVADINSILNAIV
jgi:hypothetical protein